MKQYAILYGGLICIRHSVAANQEAAIAKFLEHSPHFTGQVSAKLVQQTEPIEITQHLI